MLLKNDFKIIGAPILKMLCKRAGIKNYSKLKKQELFDMYNVYLASKVIRKFYRMYFYKEAVDHITLEPVGYPCFVYRTKSGKHYFYNYDSIIKYIMKTGKCVDPMTREPYTDNDLVRLDAQAKQHKFHYRSTFKIKKNLGYARRIQNRENEILSFQMRMDELKDMLYYYLSSEMYSWNLGNEPILIENVEYTSIDSFIHSSINELNMVLVNLRNYDSHSANCFKQNFIDSIKELQLPQECTIQQLICSM
jgi:hypothetical protein